MFLSYAAYMGKMFWPQNLAVFYPFDGGFSLLPVALSALLLLVVTVFVISFSQKQKYLLVGWLWFVGTLIPVIGLVRFTGSSYADRFTYIPYIGLFIMITWGIAELFRKWPYRKIALGVLMVIVLVAMGIVSYRQVSYWKNGFTLFSHAIEVTQNNPMAYNNLGVAYGNLGRHQEAMESCKQAVLMKPDYAEAYHNLCVAYGNLGRYQEAMEACKQAILIKPDYVEAYYKLGIAYSKLGRYPEALEAFNRVMKLKPDDAKIYLNLGSTYNSTGNLQQAVDAYKHCLKIDPSNAEAYNKLGAAFANLRRYSEAIDAYKKALEINPNLIEVRNNLAVLLLGQNKVDEAISCLKRSLEIKPNNLMTKNNLAWILAASGDPNIRNSSEAIRLAQEVCTATNYKNPSMLDTLGVAYASAGRFADAIEISKTALTLADKAGYSKIKDDIQYHLTFYTQGKPYIETAQKRPRDPNKP